MNFFAIIFPISSIRMPFNWKEPVGYFFALLVLIVLMASICHNCVCVVGLLVGFFGIILSFGLNVERKLGDSCENYTMTGNHVKFGNELRDLIHLHSRIKQFSMMLVLSRLLIQ